MKNYIEKYEDFSSQMKQLREKIPKTTSGFTSLHKKSTILNALSSIRKELISVRLVIIEYCVKCIVYKCTMHLKMVPQIKK